MSDLTIQQKLKEILYIKEIDGNGLAKMLKVNPSQVSRWLSGQQKPSGETYYKICEIYKNITKEDENNGGT